IPLLVVFTRQRVWGGLLRILPLCLPFLLIAGIAIARYEPKLPSSFIHRVTASPSKDANVQERLASTSVVMSQFHPSPLYRVGFGRSSQVTTTAVSSTGAVYTSQEEVSQDPHDGYVYLLAGGGLLALVPFLLLIVAYAVHVRRLFRKAVDPFVRPLLLWSSLSLLVIL